MEDIFLNDDLRRYIFSFLRKTPKKACQDCKKVLVWDNQVNEYMEPLSNVFFGFKDASYCQHCYYNRLNVSCIVS